MRARIRAGDLRVPVFIGKPSITRDNTGAERVTWADQKTFAMFEPLTGREWMAANMLKDAVDIRITIRYIPQWVPSARWRVVDPATGITWQIVTVMVNQSLAVVECLARNAEGNTDGR
jgi:SPP1 family predicted phage head-tail adaptor